MPSTLLTIRPAQRRVFEQVALKKFEDEMVLHSRAFSPGLCEVIGEEQLRAALRRAMATAAGYGFTNRGPIRLFIEMMFLFGSAFDTDPQYPWAAKFLKASDDQMRRAEGLFGKINEYQERVSGPDDANTQRALLNFSALAQKPPAFSPNDFAPRLRQELSRAFPAKAACIGDARLTALIGEGCAEARKRSFPLRGQALVALLMFALGHGCADDPLYPWIGATLNDHSIADPLARADRLERKAVSWFDHLLAVPADGAQA